FDDEGLSTLEKIYLFSRSQANFHKVFITHAMPSILPQVSAVEAVEYVLPLLNGLAMDEDEGVKEALATELVPIIWWFTSNCRLTDDESADPTAEPTPLLVQAFTPILGTLLLSHSAPVGSAARLAIVEILRRVHTTDVQALSSYGDEIFGEHERHLLEQEILQQVVIGIGRLDLPDEGQDEGMQMDLTSDDFAHISHALTLSNPSRTSSPVTHRSLHSPPPHLPLPISPPLGTPLSAAARGRARGGAPAAASADCDDAGEQAAVGRLSSMSLMAAVSASGFLEDSTKNAFVKEVERVGRDPVYWVRKEVSYALGALAKVVPVEVVHMALLPLFDSLSTDPVWHVRHSALFALPVILSRLSPWERRALALRTIIPLSSDTSPAVRLRVLEALGEVMYSFRDDPGGPPDAILRLFLGAFAPPHLLPAEATPAPSPVKWPDRVMNPGSSYIADGLFNEPARPLICAFNLPAVALTLGRERWPELRALYEALSQCEAMKVRRTLAASAGELARIVGPAHATRDVLPVWRAAVTAPEVEVRLKAIDSVGILLGTLPQAGVVALLEERWDSRGLGWKERESLTSVLIPLMQEGGGAAVGAVGALLRRALEDEVAAVRDAGVRAVPAMFKALAAHPAIAEQLGADVRALARSGTFRRRMTFVACYQALLAAEGYHNVLPDNPYWQSLVPLATDAIVDVRIGVARLVGTTCDQFARNAHAAPPNVGQIAVLLRADASAGVRAYVPVPPATAFQAADPALAGFATFSRPPPPTPTPTPPA
ncbi:ARM repeat-containing protein, partial [Auriscalpium vulgare]